MTPERWQQVKALLDAALDSPPAERGAFVAAACRGDDGLRREVEALLALEAEVGDFIATPIFSFRGEEAAEDPSLGRRVGPYRLLARLGRGGMGSVYLAERADGQFEQRVAVKLIQRGMDSEAILRRFRTERQILANLKHDHIARLLDGGTTDEGLPYFVLEYVEGQPIDRYCDEGRLSVAERLRLVHAVCGAVQFAHQNLVVHRDLKPGNILVTGEGIPKLLDFGIAKLLAPEAGGAAGETVLGELPMTPGYASPEQLRGEPITTASDVYSLGVLLYELLTGRRPYGVDTTSRAGWLRALEEREPLRPSSAVRRPAAEPEAGEAPTVLVGGAPPHPEAGPRRLARRLAGDLDNIVLKAIAIEPERRYASAEQLGEDVRRYLAGLPVEARQDTLGYRAAKFVRRHRLGVASAVTVAALLVGFAVTMAVQRQQVAHQRDQARRERDRAQVVTDFLVDVFDLQDPRRARGESLTAREALDRGAERIGQQLAGEPETQAVVLDTVGHVYRNLGLFEEAEDHFEQALALREQALGREHPLTAESLHNLAAAINMQGGDVERVEALLREAIAIQRRTLTPPHLELARGLTSLGNFLVERGELPEAEAVLVEALAQKRSLVGEGHPEILETLHPVARLRWRQGNLAEAESLLRQVLAGQRRAFTSPHPDLAMTLNNLALLLVRRGRPAEAEPLYVEDLAMRRKLFEHDNPRLARALNNLAFFLQGRGKLDEAEPLYREALGIDVTGLGDGHRETAVVKRNFASLLAARGDAGCEPLARQALAVLGRPGSREPWRPADTASVLGGCLIALGRFGEAEPLVVEGLAALEAAKADEPYLGDARRRVVALYEAWGKPELAALHRPQPAGT